MQRLSDVGVQLQPDVILTSGACWDSQKGSWGAQMFPLKQPFKTNILLIIKSLVNLQACFNLSSEVTEAMWV